MGPDQVTDLLRYTLIIAMEISAPLLIIMLLLGLFISLFQSITQITETTLVFIPKLIVVCITLGILFPWMLKVMMRFTHEVFVDKWDAIVSWNTYLMCNVLCFLH